MLKEQLTGGVFTQNVERLLHKGRPRIAFGLGVMDNEILHSLKNAQQYAHIIIVTTKDVAAMIKSFDVDASDKPEHRLAEMLVNGEVDGIVRGTVDDFQTYEAYKKLTGEECSSVPGLMELPSGQQFFLAPASNPEGWEKEERLRHTVDITTFIKEFGVSPKIAVFAGIRHETFQKEEEEVGDVQTYLRQTYEDAQWIVSALRAQGYEADNMSIDSNVAIEQGYNLLVPPNGMVGNQMFRMIMVCGGKLLSATRLGLSRWYEDNSRTEKDFTFHIKWLVALINQK